MATRFGILDKGWDFFSFRFDIKIQSANLRRRSSVVITDPMKETYRVTKCRAYWVHNRLLDRAKTLSDKPPKYDVCWIRPELLDRFMKEQMINIFSGEFNSWIWLIICVVPMLFYKQDISKCIMESHLNCLKEIFYPEHRLEKYE